MRPLTALAVLALPLSLIHAEELLIDDFEYADEAAARAVWRPDEDSASVGLMEHEGGTGLRMDCPFTTDVRRSVYDRAVDLNLSRFG